MAGDERLSENFPIIFDEKLNLPLWKDLRELKLRYNLPISSVRKFFEGLSDGVLYGTHCKKCGEKFFPPKPRCSTCGSRDVEWVEVSNVGRLLSYTVVNVKPESYQHHPDYVVGIAEADNGFKVLAWVKCENLDKLRIGMQVKIEIGKHERENTLLYYIVPET
ncbi:MAG: Zn-ribbon domain-containing OB-fold protein [Aigarchaeota archaeon]|nr:Zn-ribbon domain-containing OB-fold protein [Aigarchaeota archaeon]MDW8021666.1 Zn-ribbon domain-containing OB-fold protein [Nitrososphaerota archaeon]